ncbi:hypothetical protein J6590_046287 [Homalodisca vitripennis]|nr:hypothetical protein J6590_046287 [Homalodisca vitripennis]
MASSLLVQGTTLLLKYNGCQESQISPSNQTPQLVTWWTHGFVSASPRRVKYRHPTKHRN